MSDPLTPQDDQWAEAALRESAPHRDGSCCIVEPAFDPNTLLEWKLNPDTPEGEVPDHLVECDYCRRLMADLRRSTDIELRSFANKIPSKRPIWGVVVGIAAAAAAVLLLFARPADAPPAYEAGPLTGAMVAVRGDADGTVFLPQSRVEWVIRPLVPLKNPPAARAFYLEADEVLHQLPVSALTRVEGGTLVLEGIIKNLVGDAHPKQFLVVLATDDQDLATLDKQPWADAQAPTFRTYLVPINYQP